MRKLKWIIAIAAISFSIYSVIARSQTPPEIKFDSNANHKPEKKKWFWKVQNESEVSSKMEFANGTEMLETAGIKNETTFTTGTKNYLFRVKPTLVVPTNRDQSHIFAGLAVSATRQFGKFDVTANGQYLNSRYRKFAIVGLEVDKTFHLAEEVELRPFSNISFYIPTESGHFPVKSGTVWRNGAQFEGKLGFSRIDFTGQLIADSGAILSGKRFGANTEGTCLLPFGPFRIGPRIGYTRFIYLSTHNGQEKRDLFRYGFVFKI